MLRGSVSERPPVGGHHGGLCRLRPWHLVRRSSANCDFDSLNSGGEVMLALK